MHALEFIVLPYALSGFGVGFVVGLTGVGGGSLMTPLLVLLFGFHPAIAVGTDLLYASITKTCGTVIHHIGQTVEWRVVIWLGAGSLPASLLTLLLISRQLLSSSALASLIPQVLCSRRCNSDPGRRSKSDPPTRLALWQSEGAGWLEGRAALEIRVLRRHGKGIREIARKMGSSRNTVRRYLRDESAARYKPRPTRATKLDPFKDYIV